VTHQLIALQLSWARRS